MPVVAGPADMTAIPENAKAIVPALNDLQGRLAAVCASGAEKKQLADVDKAVNILLAKLSSGQLIVQSQKRLPSWTALSSGDAASASNIQKVLAAEFWDNHKDWIKGIKISTSFAKGSFVACNFILKMALLLHNLGVWNLKSEHNQQ